MIRIVFITHGYDWVEWTCARHIAEWRAKGATVRVGDLVVWPCDRCQTKDKEMTNGN